MAEVCETHGVLKRSCGICLLEEDNKVMREFIEWTVDVSLDKRIVEKGKKLLEEV